MRQFGGVYQPEELYLFRRVMEQSLDLLPHDHRTPEVKAKIARAILDCAATGERNPIELSIAALCEFEIEPCITTVNFSK